MDKLHSALSLIHFTGERAPEAFYQFNSLRELHLPGRVRCSW